MTNDPHPRPAGRAETGPDLEALAQKLASRLSEAIPGLVTEFLSTSGLAERVERLLSRLAERPADPETRPENGKPVPEAGRQPSGSLLCSEPDCELPARARGLCSKHYQRLRYAERRAAEAGQPPPQNLTEARRNRGRTPVRKTERRGGGICGHPGCDRPNYAKGLCGRHFMEWVRSQKSQDDPERG